MTVSATAPAADPYAGLGLDKVGATASDSQTATAERFLTMLVAQMKNQDPLNPMDNAQVTSQMAQINTVSGLEQVNMSVRSLNGQMLQMQALQGAALVGREVTVPGDRLAVADGVGRGGFDLDAKANAVRMEVLNANGTVIGTKALGALEAGRHFFEWGAGSTADTAGLRFRVVSGLGDDQKSHLTTLMRDRVTAVSTEGDALNVSLQRGGTVPASRIVAFN
jgi:flagellar basal-body rod modification protein FlgD